MPALESYAPFPDAAEGYERCVIFLPSKDTDAASLHHRVQLLAGRYERRATAISTSSGATSGTKQRYYNGAVYEYPLEGWNCSYYVVDLGTMVDSATQPAMPVDGEYEFITLEEKTFIAYDSHAPIVVYIPAGSELHYRVWADETSRREEYQNTLAEEGDTAGQVVVGTYNARGTPEEAAKHTRAIPSAAVNAENDDEARAVPAVYAPRSFQPAPSTEPEDTVPVEGSEPNPAYHTAAAVQQQPEEEQEERQPRATPPPPAESAPRELGEPEGGYREVDNGVHYPGQEASTPPPPVPTPPQASEPEAHGHHKHRGEKGNASPNGARSRGRTNGKSGPTPPPTMETSLSTEEFVAPTPKGKGGARNNNEGTPSLGSTPLKKAGGEEKKSGGIRGVWNKVTGKKAASSKDGSERGGSRSPSTGQKRNGH